MAMEDDVLRSAHGPRDRLSPRLATLTVMRGEKDRITSLLSHLDWVRERHVVDTAPDPVELDGTERVRVHHCPLPYGAAFDAARNVALPHVQADWILVVDTDERLPRTLVDYITSQLDSFREEGVEAAWIARRNHVVGHPLRFSSAWPDYQLRLFRRDKAHFQAKIHAFVPMDLANVRRFDATDDLAIRHFNFESTADFTTKLNLYSSIEADQAPDSTATAGRAVVKAAREFVGRFVRMKGYRDGAHGLHYAVMLAFYRYLIESKRWEAAGASRDETNDG